jgi:uncharacterized protein (DUF1778 family)
MEPVTIREVAEDNKNMSAVPHNSLERFSFRVEPKKKQIIERAAAARGLTLTDFAIMTLYREAKEILRTEHVLVLDDADRDAFLQALENPPTPTAKAIRAAKRYRETRERGDLG